MRIVYVLVPIRTQILALILLFIMRADYCTTALSCLLVKWIGLIGYLTEARPFTLCHGSRARGVGGNVVNRTADSLQMHVINRPRYYTFKRLRSRSMIASPSAGRFLEICASQMTEYLKPQGKQAAMF